MFEIVLFSFEDAMGEQQKYTTRDAALAQAHARKHKLRCIRNVYEAVDAGIAWNFTGVPDEVAAEA